MSYYQAPYQPPPPPKKNHSTLIVASILVVAFLCVAGCFAVVAGGIGSSVKDIGGDHKVTYVIESDSGSTGLITYTGTDLNTSQLSEVQTPWTKEVPVDGLFGGSISAQNTADGGNITCKILKDGVVEKENTSSGPYVIVSC